LVNLGRERAFSDMSREHEQSQGKNGQPELSQQNPALWQGGEKFQVSLQEQEQDGKHALTLQIFDGEEVVLVQFLGSVREARTVFLPAQTPTPLVGEPTALPAQAQEASTPVPDQSTKETEKRPVKLMGRITSIGQLEATKKKKQPMLLFTMHDEVNNVERRAVAFDTLAERLAAPETGLQANEPITLFAWKHLNAVHIQGQIREVEDWYVQKAIYHQAVFEKPRPTQKARRQDRR
jgi:hypothetical protein